MNRLGKLFVAMAIAVVPAACKEDRAEEAAENLQEQREDVREEAKDLKEAMEEQREDMRERAEAEGERRRDEGMLPEGTTAYVNEEEMKENAEEIREQTSELAKESAEMATAQSTFELRRWQRANGMRAVHSVIATQPMLINVLANVTPLTTGARAELAEDMQKFQMRLNEAGNAIEQLQMASATEFEDRDDAAEDAIERLKEARDEAWEALNDGDRIEPS